MNVHKRNHFWVRANMAWGYFLPLAQTYKIHRETHNPNTKHKTQNTHLLNSTQLIVHSHIFLLISSYSFHHGWFLHSSCGATATTTSPSLYGVFAIVVIHVPDRNAPRDCFPNRTYRGLGLELGLELRVFLPGIHVRARVRRFHDRHRQRHHQQPRGVQQLGALPVWPDLLPQVDGPV